MCEFLSRIIERSPAIFMDPNRRPGHTFDIFFQVIDPM